MNGDITIGKAIYVLLNTWNDKPTDILFEKFDKKPPSMMFQQLTGTAITRKYVSGSYTGEYPFAVAVRVDGTDTKSKFDATQTLQDLSDWIITQKPPSIGANRSASEFEVSSTPSKVAIYDDGTEDYQIIITLKYYCKGGN